MGQSGERLRGQIDFIVLDDEGCVGAKFQGCGDSVLVSWFLSGMVSVGDLRVREGQGVLLGRRQVGCQGYNKIAMALVDRCGGHGWGGWGTGVGGKLERRGSSWY